MSQWEQAVAGIIETHLQDAFSEIASHCDYVGVPTEEIDSQMTTEGADIYYTWLSWRRDNWRIDD